jgi:quercetin dioxygenase-like cupin family protein
MKIQNVPFTAIDWASAVVSKHPGVTGEAIWRTIETGNVRVRIVEYTPGYLADHWCSRGHVIHVLEGTLITELKDGRTFTITPGSTYITADDEINPHRSHTDTGVKLFIVD